MTGCRTQATVCPRPAVVSPFANVVRSLRERIPIPARRDESAANGDTTQSPGPLCATRSIRRPSGSQFAAAGACSLPSAGVTGRPWPRSGSAQSRQRPRAGPPEFFQDEAELWSAPDTRARLLHGLAEKGFGSDQLAEMQKLIDAEKSDLFDVLAFVAYSLPTLSREERATNARAAITTQFNHKQQAFLDFVLAQYVKVGVHELDREKLAPLLKLKYNNAIADAIADLGRPEEIGKVFAGFQRYLYQEATAA